MVRSLTDRLLTVLAGLVLRGFFRSVEIVGRERVPKDRPLLIVANHAGGFLDPVVLTRLFGRLPRFIAKSTLWRPVWVRPFLWLAGMIPVHRRQDHAGGSDNVRTFQEAERVLCAGGLVGIFPEGRTHDEAGVSRVHTGAARIALGAHAAGAPGLVVVAVGVTFDDKIALRSRVLLSVGEPIELDEVAPALPRSGAGRAAPDGTDRAAVRALTDLMAQRLRAVAPNYESVREARVLATAAEIRLRSADEPDSPEVALSQREALARRLARASPDRRSAVTHALAHYLLDLQVAGLREEQISAGHGAGTLARGTLRTIVIVTLISPLAVAGLVWNWPPYAIVTVVGRVARTPVSKGTARLVTALVAFPVAWSVVAVADPFEGAWSGVAIFVLAPLLGLVALAAVERVARVYLAWRSWVGLAERRALVGDVRASRAEVVCVVDAALAETVPVSPADRATSRTAVGR
jgi:glycerol-3-phosphate O-acyltransferase / dihydroxyacetone phosphate acyltransferase